jgi:hypothetical protein
LSCSGPPAACGGAGAAGPLGDGLGCGEAVSGTVPCTACATCVSEPQAAFRRANASAALAPGMLAARAGMELLTISAQATIAAMNLRTG